MHKGEFLKTVQKRLSLMNVNLTTTQINEVLREMVNLLVDEITTTGGTKLSGFGKFTVKEHKGGKINRPGKIILQFGPYNKLHYKPSAKVSRILKCGARE